jgi:tetratricopeptide (TPR) repeat protein
MLESIDDKTHAEITKKTDLGNVYMDREQWQDAIAVFESALSLLPEPKYKWEAYTWIMASIGDAYFSMRDFATAERYFSEAAQWIDGQQNAFVMLRLGEVSFELGKFAVADDSLMRAYLLMGISIFDGEDPKYLRHMQEKFKIS